MLGYFKLIFQDTPSTGRAAKRVVTGSPGLSRGPEYSWALGLLRCDKTGTTKLNLGMCILMMLVLKYVLMLS